jgi:hypothetical protein
MLTSEPGADAFISGYIQREGWTGAQDDARRTELRDVDIHLLYLRKFHPNYPEKQGVTIRNVLFYGQDALMRGYGNCLEQSCAAASWLNDHGFFDYDLIYYPQGDHIFVAIGQPTASRDYAGKYPDDFAAWDANAAICDCWADIACPAQDYPARWRARMGNWQIMGVRPANQQPTDPAWRDIVDGPKKSYFYRR